MSRQLDRAPTQRQLRVGEEIRHTLALAFERGEVHDPALAGRSLTVTEVRISPDLKNATAFVVPLGGGDLGDTIDVLNRAAGFLRTYVGRNVRLRHVPRLSFQADTSFDEADRIDRVMRNPQVAQDINRRSADEEDDA